MVLIGRGGRGGLMGTIVASPSRSSPVFIKFAEGSTDFDSHQTKAVYKLLRRTMDMHCDLGT